MRALRKENLISMKIRGYGRSRGRPEKLILLTEEGTQFLKKKGILSGDVDYSMDKIVNSHFVDHELLINWFCIHVLQIERVNPELSVHYLNNHNSSSLAQDKDERPFLQERVPVNNGQDKFLEFIPDGVFSITNLKAEPPKTLLFFLEVDMSTETLASTDKNSKDVRQKIINYQTLFRSGHYKRYESLFDASINGFRLLFLANTSARLASLCKLIKELPPSDFVWLTTPGTHVFPRFICRDLVVLTKLIEIIDPHCFVWTTIQQKPQLVPGLLSNFDFMWTLFHRLEGKTSDEEIFAHSPDFHYILCGCLAGLEIGDV